MQPFYRALWPLLSIVGVVYWLTSCTISRRALTGADSYCVPTTNYTYDSTLYPLVDIGPILAANPALARRFSMHNLLMANATGTLQLLSDVLRLQHSQTTADQLTYLSKRQQMATHLQLAASEIDGLAAELDCEGERADQLAYFLDEKNNRRIKSLTILSVVVGAITTVATTLVNKSGAQNAVAISGGVSSATLGGLAALSSNATVAFFHKRNLLADIWHGPEQSAVYSPFVWYVLHEKQFSNSGQNSIRRNIRQRWETYMLGAHVHPSDSPEKQTLYFGEGGHYDADDLHLRANMLNQLQASVRSIDQDLESLLLAIAREN